MLVLKRWSKIVTPLTKKRFLKKKEVTSGYRDSDFDVKHDVQDIVSTTRKKTSRKKVPSNIPEVPNDNISFHFVENVEKWEFI